MAQVASQATLFPQGGWDVHHHIYEQFTYAEDRHLTPTAATTEQFLAFRSSIGITHSVLTHGLCYGSDCSSLSALLKKMGSQSTKGIGVIDPIETSDEDICEMHRCGVRGIRANLYKYGAMHDLELQKQLLETHANRLKAVPGWTMAFTQLHPEFWAELRAVIERKVNPHGVRLVTDHFALLKGRSMLADDFDGEVENQPGFQAILSLVRDGLLWIKLSAPYRVSQLSPGYEDLEPLVRAFVSANPRRVLWGSDWPHTPQMRVRTREEALAETPNLVVDDAAWLKSLRKWLTDKEWDLMMRVNPKELYDW